VVQARNGDDCLTFRFTSIKLNLTFIQHNNNDMKTSKKTAKIITATAPALHHLPTVTTHQQHVIVGEDGTAVSGVA